MTKKQRFAELQRLAKAIARHCQNERISYLDIPVGGGAVIWKNLQVPLMRENETVRIENGTMERY